MKKISIQELTKMVCDLPINRKIYLKQYVDSELFGIACLNLFESDLIVLSHFGGGPSAIFNTSVTNEEKEICSWLRYAFKTGDNNKIVYLLDEKEVDGEQAQHELWGVTFRVNQPGSNPYRTLAISECSLFPTQEEAEAWIDRNKGLCYDSAFDAEDCSDPKAILIDTWQYNSGNAIPKTSAVLTIAPDFTSRINNLHADIISNIISILNDNNLSEIELDGIIKEPTFVLWSDGETWYDLPVVTVSLADKGISIDVEDKDENISSTLYSGEMDLAFQNPFWLRSIRDNIEEAIEAIKGIKNNTQLSILKNWNLYLKDNDGEEPHYASVSILFKDNGSESKEIISLTDHSEGTTDQIFHYIHSRQELIELADTDTEATVQNFIITGINEFSDHI